MTNRIVLAVIFAVQILCAAFFVAQILITVLGLDVGPFDWVYIELIEIGAAIGLLLGVAMGAFALTKSRARTIKAEEALRRARSAFRDVLDERFAEWELTEAERDVALFAIKGFATHDIAGFRGVSEGTVKAQTNAIYRKAGVTGRPQLLSLFIDELVEDAAPQESTA